jgi:hypothetical protein
MFVYYVIYIYILFIADLIISSGLLSVELQLIVHYRVQELWPRRRIICYWSGVRNIKKLTKASYLKKLLTKTSHFKTVMPWFIKNSVVRLQITIPLCVVKYRTLPLGNGQYTGRFCRVLMMVYSIRHYWVLDWPLSGILKNKMFGILDLILSLGERMGDIYSVGSVRKS